jgi:hypothetical protein
VLPGCRRACGHGAAGVAGVWWGVAAAACVCWWLGRVRAVLHVRGKLLCCCGWWWCVRGVWVLLLWVVQAHCHAGADSPCESAAGLRPGVNNFRLGLNTQTTRQQNRSLG